MKLVADSYRKRMTLGQDGNSLVHLLVINAVLFVILKFIYVIYLLTSVQSGPSFTSVFSWFVLPADLQKLAGRPWTIVTYMFSDLRVFRFIANMIWLWSFGSILQDLTGNRKLAPIYIYGGLAGAASYLLAFHLMPQLHAQIPDAQLIGANTAIVAVAVAATTVAPDYRIFPMINGGIPLWVLMVIYGLLNFSSIQHGGSGEYISNISAAAVGFLFIYQMRRGKDWSGWMNNFFDWCHDLFNPGKMKKNKASKGDFYYNVSGTQPFKKIPNITQKRIDDILDKINQQGYRFLTEEEKDILKRAAEKEDL
jgi:membrane associated rhomboid family serine protease